MACVCNFYGIGFKVSKNHQFLEVVVPNIAVTPYSVYENDLLCEYFKSELEDAEDIQSVYDTFFSAEYFTYDFNYDGIEDYLVSLSGSGWSGALGNHVAIVCAGEDGSVTEVFSATVRFAENGENSGYSSVTVLNELVDGFYSFRFEGYDKIWKYNPLNGRYE